MKMLVLNLVDTNSIIVSPRHVRYIKPQVGGSFCYVGVEGLEEDLYVRETAESLWVRVDEALEDGN